MSNLKRFSQGPDGMVPDVSGGWVLWSEAVTAARDAKHARALEKDEVNATVKYERDRTNALLNELYHDRARLEKIVANAAELAYDVTLQLEWLRLSLPNQDLGGELMVSQVALAEFADANGA